MFKTVKDGQLPTRGSKYSACVDLCAREDVTIGAGETKLIPLGVAIDLKQLRMARYEETAFSIKRNVKEHNIRFPYEWDKFLNTHYLQLMLRSSLSKELIIANGVGVIDLDYKDEIMIRVHKPTSQQQFHHDASGAICGYTSDEPLIIKRGQRVAQITLLEHKGYLFGIDTEDERDGGFGSTDEKDKR